MQKKSYRQMKACIPLIGLLRIHLHFFHQPRRPFKIYSFSTELSYWSKNIVFVMFLCYNLENRFVVGNSMVISIKSFGNCSL